MMGKSLPVVKHWQKFLFANFVNSYNGFSRSFGMRKLWLKYKLLLLRILFSARRSTLTKIFEIKFMNRNMAFIDRIGIWTLMQQHKIL